MEIKPTLCDNFDDFSSKISDLAKEGAWVFRGQRLSEWPLATKYERACTRYCISKDKKVELEYAMIREFRRRLHHYLTNIPLKDQYDEWIALMQHHGAPTRFLDFTYSYYIAAYFAFENAEPDTEVAIWALRSGWLENLLESSDEPLFKKYKSYQKNREKPSYFKSIFKFNQKRGRKRLVLPVNPFFINERLASQKGVFLCPGDITATFWENLTDFIGNEDFDNNFIKFTIETGTENENSIDALIRLHSMNITRITLFPGLDGFAQSFAPRIRPLFIQQSGFRD